MDQKLRCTIKVLDEVNCRVDGLRSNHIEALRAKYGEFVEGYRWQPTFQLGRWDGKIYFFSDRGETYTKLLDEIVPLLVNFGYEINLDDQRLPAPTILDRIDENVFGLPDFKLRPYQVDVINALLSEGSGMAIMGTGAGKTSTVAALSLVLYLNGIQTIVVVPSTDLVNQTVEEFQKVLRAYDMVTVGAYSGSFKDIDHPIVVATWQSLQNAPHYVSGGADGKGFGAFIIDEAHGAKSNVLRDLVSVHGKHIAFRYGCTGTLPKPAVDKLTIRTIIGPVIREVPAKWLMDQGYLSKLTIHPIQTLDVNPDVPDYASERAYLTKHEDRNEALAIFIQQIREQHGNTMVLVNTQSLAQGRALLDLIEDSTYLDGGSESEVRQAAYELYNDHDNVLTIASMGIASTGLSIDRIFALVLLDAGKSFTKSIQAIGRGLRKKGDKTEVHVYDIHSNLKFAKKHFKERNGFYKEAEYNTAPLKKMKY